MKDKHLEEIIKNQELQIALLTELLREQPTLSIAETDKLREYRGY